MGWDEKRWDEARRVLMICDEMKCGVWSAKCEVRRAGCEERSVKSEEKVRLALCCNVIAQVMFLDNNAA